MIRLVFFTEMKFTPMLVRDKRMKCACLAHANAHARLPAFLLEIIGTFTTHFFAFAIAYS